MSETERVFEARPYTKRESRLIGWFLIASSAGIAAFLIVDGFDDVPQAILSLGLCTFFAGLGVQTVRRAGNPTERLTVVTNAEGVRIGKRPLISWSEIDGLRAGRHEVEVLRGGKRIGSISTSLDDSPLAVGIVLRNIVQAVPPARSIRGRVTADLAFNAVLFTIAAAVAVFLIRSGRPFLGGGILAFELWLAIDAVRTWIWRIDFGDSAMRLRYLLGGKEIPRSHVQSFDIIVSAEIYAVAFLMGEKHLRLTVPGVDPFVIYVAARRAWGMA